MKRPMLALSMTAALTLSGPALAGPPPGHHYFRGSTFMRRPNPRPRLPVVQQNNAAVPEAAKFRWKSALRWIGGHKYRRIVRIREPTH